MVHGPFHYRFFSLSFQAILSVFPSWPTIQQNAGKPFPQDFIDGAKKEVNEFCHILEQEGVKVRRPDVVDHGATYETPDFKASGKTRYLDFQHKIIKCMS
jgi:hypothetical protein